MRDFVIESNRIEGINGCTTKQLQAHVEFLQSAGGVADIERFVWEIATERLRDYPDMNVMVGQHIAPRGGPEIRPALERILQGTDPYRVHCDYLTLHPFMDGNGRSARVLWLKMMGGIPPRIGFLHTFYYQTLQNADGRTYTC